jgi:fructokinase
VAQSPGALDNSRPVIFGEVLFDKFQDGSVVLGGAPFNVAWHLQAFGLSPLMISRIGNDPLGREIRSTMQEWGMDASGIQLDSAHPTGTVEVCIKDGEPAFNIVARRAYDYIDSGLLPPVTGTGVVYHGSLVLREKTSRNALRKLKQLISAPSFVDINLRPPWWTEEIIEEIIQEANWLKLNEQELNHIIPGGRTLENRMNQLLDKYSLHYLVVTQGSDGATAATHTGEKYSIGVDCSLSVVDTVGAGDAFSSVLILGQARGWPLSDTLRRAQQFASAIVCIRGAVEKHREFYYPFIENWGLADK